MAAPIPDTMGFADAAVLPLGLGIAANGLCGQTQLALELPSHEAPVARVEDVIQAMLGHRLAGTLYATRSMHDCLAAVAHCEGLRRAAATLAPPEQRPAGIEATHIFGTSLKDDAAVPMIYRDLLPQALTARTFVTAPPTKVLGHGLESLQVALNALKPGISVGKVVVTLQVRDRHAAAPA